VLDPYEDDSAEKKSGNFSPHVAARIDCSHSVC